MGVVEAVVMSYGVASCGGVMVCEVEVDVNIRVHDFRGLRVVVRMIVLLV